MPPWIADPSASVLYKLDERPSPMPFTPHGHHLIAGAWRDGAAQFESAPAHGPAHRFSTGTPELVAEACAGAEDAFWSYGYSTRDSRAAFLDAIADEIEARAEAITEIGSQETGLPEARLNGERGRTTGQLRLFASHIRDGAYLDRRHDKALPDRQPMPRPDIRLLERPIGPVAVFGASNFPLAFSTAGATPQPRWRRVARWWSKAIPPIRERARSWPRRSWRRSNRRACIRVSFR